MRAPEGLGEEELDQEVRGPTPGNWFNASINAPIGSGSAATVR
jgi:hypothetical protein